jgi:hypothetical protein
MESKTIEVYYDLGLFKDARDVEEFLKDSFSFLMNRENDIHIMTGKNNDKFVTCNPIWREFITTEQLQKYYSRAKKIYFPDFNNKEVARNYYEDYLGVLGEGDLYSLVNKDESYAVFLIMYLLMLKDNIAVKVLTKNI